jgi:hypothetical protein
MRCREIRERSLAIKCVLNLHLSQDVTQEVISFAFGSMDFIKRLVREVRSKKSNNNGAFVNCVYNDDKVFLQVAVHGPFELQLVVGAYHKFSLISGWVFQGVDASDQKMWWTQMSIKNTFWEIVDSLCGLSIASLEQIFFRMHGSHSLSCQLPGLDKLWREVWNSSFHWLVDAFKETQNKILSVE